VRGTRGRLGIIFERERLHHRRVLGGVLAFGAEERVRNGPAVARRGHCEAVSPDAVRTLADSVEGDARGLQDRHALDVDLPLGQDIGPVA